jgi:hypothetical protein
MTGPSEYFYDVFGLEKDNEELTPENFIVPKDSDYVDFGEETEDISAASLWENIRKKKERMGKNYKPAKPGDPDRPSKDAFKKAQSSDDNEMAVQQLEKMHMQLMEVSDKLKIVEFEDWTKDMISKAEVYIQNVYDFIKAYDPNEEMEEDEEEEMEEGYGAEYQGRKVTLNKPFRTPKESKKFAVYVRNKNGKVVIVRFGDPKLSIKRDIPSRKKSYCDRSKNLSKPGDKTSPNYWSRRQWNC